MKKNEFINLIEDILEEDHGTLDGSESLEDVGWDSMTFMSFISLVDSRLGLALAPAQITAANTVDDLVGLVSEKLED